MIAVESYCVAVLAEFISRAFAQVAYSLEALAQQLRIQNGLPNGDHLYSSRTHESDTEGPRLRAQPAKNFKVFLARRNECDGHIQNLRDLYDLR